MTEYSQNKKPKSYQAKGGGIRPSQIITTFGPGAIVDLPEDSVMIAGVDDWPPGEVIHEHRLEQALDVEQFRAPALKKQGGDIPCVRFPRNLICSQCGLITWKKTCPECNGSTYPARLIIICPAGHADEFPWYWWVHRDQKCRGKSVLRLESEGRTATLADMVVRCDTCGKRQPLAGALGPKALQHFSCNGKRPWLIGATTDETCNAKPRSVLRGASNVYFSSLLSALSIPPWSNPIHAVLNDHWHTVQHLSEEPLKAVIAALPEMQGFHVQDVIRAINERKTSTATTTTLRKDEFLAFRNPGSKYSDPDFHIQREPVPDSFAAYIAQVVLAFRLREVRVLLGFTRIDPPDTENSKQQVTPIALNPQKWLPAVEHRGEGIFIELAEDRVKAWEARTTVKERIQPLNQAYTNWRGQRGLPPSTHPLLPRLVLVHTLAHLFIRQLSLDCGYSSSALRERIYAASDMCGLLIYTASADADGSLGGLVQQGRTTRFEATMQALLENAQWCSSDPLCSEHNPTQTGKLNGAACHACGLVSETSCEYGNRFLDRALICDLVEVSGAGYFG
jgi:hypothetical protein